MGACCAGTYGDVFTDRVAVRDARRYRRRGVDPTARRMIAWAVESGLAGASVLEVGGGIGAVQLELLKAGASRGVTLELSGGYDEAASSLARDAQLESRVERRILDLVAEPQAVEPADVVVLHRVVCCYPDAEALLAAAAGRTRRVLLLSYPRPAWWARAAVALGNAWQRLRRRAFRGHVHQPTAMLAVLEAGGLRPAWTHRGTLWHAAAVERPR